MSGLKDPPRFVPTLTEVVEEPLPQEGPDATVDSEASVPGSAGSAEADAVRRVLRHIDRVLENRLQEALGKLVQDQSRALASQLREEIAQVVHECMSRAFEEAARSNPAPAPNP